MRFPGWQHFSCGIPLVRTPGEPQHLGWPRDLPTSEHIFGAGLQGSNPGSAMSHSGCWQDSEGRLKWGTSRTSKKGYFFRCGQDLRKPVGNSAVHWSTWELIVSTWWEWPGPWWWSSLRLCWLKTWLSRDYFSIAL